MLRKINYQTKSVNFCRNIQPGDYVGPVSLRAGCWWLLVNRSFIIILTSCYIVGGLYLPSLYCHKVMTLLRYSLADYDLQRAVCLSFWQVTLSSLSLLSLFVFFSVSSLSPISLLSPFSLPSPSLLSLLSLFSLSSLSSLSPLSLLYLFSISSPSFLSPLSLLSLFSLSPLSLLCNF